MPLLMLVGPKCCWDIVRKESFSVNVMKENSEHRSKLSVKACLVVDKFISTFQFLVYFNKIFKAIRQMS